MKERSLVSLITPGWNGVGFIHNLLDSILAQSYRPIEYIYVDDGSYDGTKDIVLSYKQKFENKGISFKYIFKKNGGVSSAINEGLKYVTGDYLGWPEYDDILAPSSIERRVHYLENHKDCAVVTCDAWLVNENAIDKPIGRLSCENPNRFDRNHFVQALLSNSIFTAACHLVRMDIFDKTHPNRFIYPSRIGPNWQMLLPIYYKHNRGFIEDPLVYYVIRQGSISHSHDTLEKRLNAIDEYKKILHNVLSEIEMPPEDLQLYNSLLSEHYAYVMCDLGFEFKSREVFSNGCSYFTSQNIELPQKITIQRKLLYETSFQKRKRRLKKKIFNILCKISSHI